MRRKTNRPTGANRFPLIALVFMLAFLACGLPSRLSTPENPTRQSSNIIVSITEPLDGEAYPVSAGLSIHAETISDTPITNMELWADGEIFEEYRAPEEKLGFLTHTWIWSPEMLGAHTLMVRASNKDGETAFSNAINITAIADPGFTLITKVEESDTILSVAKRYGVTVDEILQQNPNLASSNTLIPGEEIFIHISPTQTTSGFSTDSKVALQISNRNDPFTSHGIESFHPPSAPLPPTLQLASQGCNAILSVADQSTNEAGFQIYRLKPGAVSFAKLETLPAHDGADPVKYTDSNLYGLYQYYVSAFDGSSESKGNLASISITDPACAGEAVTITDLTTLPSGVDEYYLYVAFNNGNWQRFPGQEFTYLKKSQNIDFGQVASSLAPKLAGNFTMRGEVWGMVNGNAVLLGNFEKTFKSTNTAPLTFNPASINNLFTTSLEVRGIPILDTKKYNWVKTAAFDYDTKIFRWGTDTGATQGIWQVASAPFPKEASLNPACLLLTKTINEVGTPASPYEFPIDFSSIKPKTTIGNLNTPLEINLNLLPLFSQPYSPQKLTSPGEQVVVNVPKWGNEGFDSSKPILPPDPCALNISSEGILSYYVRILPMNNGQSAGNPSNTVVMTHDPTPPEPIKIDDPHPPNLTFYDVKIVNFTGVHAPDLKYENCVEIVKNPYYPSPILYKFGYAKPGDIVCPDKFTGGGDDFWDDLSNAVESAFDFISNAYNKLSDWAVKLVEELNPLCQAAKLTTQTVNTGQGEVKDACHYVAELAVAAAKTYVGLPPTLPNFDELTSLGKDYLVNLAVQELEAKGVPCPDACKQAIEDGINYSLEQVKNSMSNSSCFGEQEAHEMGIEPLCAPKGVITKPDPRGQPAPAVVEVQVTRRPGTDAQNIPQPTSCNFSIGVNAKNDSHVGEHWETSAGYEWTGVPIEGSVLHGGGLIPILQSNSSTGFPIILNPTPYWLPGHKIHVIQGWKPAHWDDWHILYEGANAAVTATGTCNFNISNKDVISYIAIQGDSKQVGPLGKAWPQFCHPNCPQP